MGLLSKAMDYLDLGNSREASGEVAPVAVPSSAPVSRPASRLSSISRRSGDGATQIQSLDPRTFQDSAEIAAWFRGGVPVIVNFGQLSEVDASRMLYFLLGLKEGLEGHIKRITPKVFILTPNSVGINDEEDPVANVDVIQP